MKFTNYLKTPCPHCGSKDHKIYSTEKHGCFKVRYHICNGCAKVAPDGKPRKFRSHEHIGSIYVDGS